MTLDLSRATGQPHLARPRRDDPALCAICDVAVAPSRVPGHFIHVDADGRPAAAGKPRKER
jgi:hypothetical protein